MAQTQLASMFIGNPHVIDRDERLRGVASRIGNIIHITDGKTDRILDVVTANTVIDNVHRKSLKDTLETFDFRVIGGMRYERYLEKYNRVIIPDEDDGLIEFIIDEVGKYRDTEGLKAEVYTYASYLDLRKASIIDPTTLTEYTASMHVGFALDGTEWSPGVIEGSGHRTLRIEEHTNPYAYLKRVAREFELELNFRVEHDGQRVTGRYVDLLERVGAWRGREVVFGVDLEGIRRVEKGDIYTALLGLSPEDEDGNRLEVFVEDEDALARWGRPDPVTDELKHLVDVYEPTSDRSDMTLAELEQYTRTELDKRINAVIEYEANILDLEHVPGLHNKKIRFGDTIRIKDTSFNPSLYLEARVHTQERDVITNARKNVELGDFIEFTEDEVFAIWKELRAEIRKRVSVSQLEEYAEPKKVVSDTPPTQSENVVWVDTSQEPYVPKVYNFGEWQKMSPTEAVEIGAETPQGAQLKADDAETNAKNFAKDASNIETGIIDVGAVPLRTSVTGARIEWDGVNGFVQYDAQGNPVAWIDLEGDVYFEDGYFRGEIHGESGSFSGDISGSTGTFGEVTVDEGDLTVKDALSNVKALVPPLPNLLGDHNFEDLIIDWNTENETYNWYEMINPAGTDNVDYHMTRPYWRKYGSPKVARVPEYGVADHRAKPIFDNQAIVVRNANYVRQLVYDGIGAGGVYTISGYFKRHWGQTAGRPRFEVDFMHQGQLHTRLINEIYDTVPSDYTVIRFAATFTVPSSFQAGDYLDVKISGGNSNWVQCDGVQLVAKNLPTVYNPESTAYLALNEDTQKSLWIGEYYPLETHTIRPLTPLSQCREGWLIKWQAYNQGEGRANNDFQYTFIPKGHIYAAGAGIRVLLARGSTLIFKYIYVYDDRIVGHASNNQDDNHRLAMTEVFAV